MTTGSRRDKSTAAAGATGGADPRRAAPPAPHLLPRHPLVLAVRPIVEALGAQVLPLADREPGDLPLKWEGTEVAVVRMAPLHGALERLIEGVERELGNRLPLLGRADKQRAIRLLDERGAFTLRRAVEDVADAMGVSRITVYNYLNALHRPT
jgi:hypothetical protein